MDTRHNFVALTRTSPAGILDRRYIADARIQGLGSKLSGSERAPMPALPPLWESRFPLSATKAPRDPENLYPLSLTRDSSVLRLFGRI
jgi:hypothetical protein